MLIRNIDLEQQREDYVEGDQNEFRLITDQQGRWDNNSGTDARERLELALPDLEKPHGSFDIREILQRTCSTGPRSWSRPVKAPEVRLPPVAWRRELPAAVHPAGR